MANLSEMRVIPKKAIAIAKEHNYSILSVAKAFKRNFKYQFSKYLGRFWDYLNFKLGKPINSYNIHYLIENSVFASEDAFFKSLEESASLIIFNNDEKREFVSFIKKHYPSQVDGIIKTAEKTCKHQFKIFSDVWHQLGETSDVDEYKEIPWHWDFINGFTWSKMTPFYSIGGNSLGKGDLKVPIELSRLQHLAFLGMAYLISKDEKYAKEFRSQVDDWITNNPVGRGVNWSCTMDVGIRAVNLLLAMEMFKGYAFPREFLISFQGTIHQHANFINGHLEYYPNLTNNHLLTDLASLLIIALKCPFYAKSRYWRDRAFAKLIEEVKKQIYPDGVDFEASTCYHALVLEILFITLVCLRRYSGRGYRFTSRVAQKMGIFLIHAMKNDGTIPQVGDNDNGNFFKLINRPSTDKAYLADLVSIFFEKIDFKLDKKLPEIECVLLLGNDCVGTWNAKQPINQFTIAKLFPDAGWSILRTQGDYCFISSGQNGQNGIGGHAHNDKLGFELVLDGETLLVDPGTYSYSSSIQQRNAFRSGKSHNVVIIDGIEQGELTSNRFKLRQRLTTKVIRTSKMDESLIFQGRLIYPNGTIHERKIILREDMHCVEIKDQFRSNREKKKAKINFNFILHPDCVFDESASTITKNGKKFSIRARKKGLKLTKQTGRYSAGYGLIEKSVRLSGIIEETLPFQTAIEITKI